jgi:hypothetical protein
MNAETKVLDDEAGCLKDRRGNRSRARSSPSNMPSAFIGVYRRIHCLSAVGVYRRIHCCLPNG